MPSLSDHQSTEFTKLLLIGDSGTGKTSALASLVKEGYDLGIVDMDNGLDSLVAILRRDCPERLSQVSFQSFRDKRKVGTAGVGYAGSTKAFRDAMSALDKWPDDGSKPSEWGPKKVLVLDSMTFLGEAAFAWAESMNPSAKDPRQWYGAAQDSVEAVIAALTDPDFKCNVVVVSHIRWLERQDGQTKGYPSAIGGALSTKIATYFNTVLLSESTGSGANAKKTIRASSTSLIDLKAPGLVGGGKTYPLETALADFFREAQTGDKK